MGSDYECGLGAWKPEWLQKFATPKCFMLVYGMLGTVQAMAFVYFISTLTTIEKRFGIQSKTTGWMLSGNEVSQIMLSLILTYYGGQRNRPVWMAWGVAFSALSCFILATPHFIFGAGPAALALTKEYQEEFKHYNHSSMLQKEREGLCTEEWLVEDCSNDKEGSIAPLLIFLSQFFLGIGTTLYYSLGQPYIDDNTKKSNTPILLGLSMSLRMIGPLIAFGVVFLCLRTYIDPSLTPTIGPKDPRWLGAWWLGWVILGSVMFLQAFLIALFPKKLKKSIKVEKVAQLEQGIKEKNDINSNGTGKSFIGKKEDAKPPTTKEFLPSLMKLLKNKVLMVNTFAGIFYILGSSGYMTFMTKNMEVQFYQTSSEANIITGPVILVAIVGAFIISGYVISKFKPRPTYLLGWNVVVGIVFVISEIMYIFIACPDIDIIGYDSMTKSFRLESECNSHCGCEMARFAPVYLEENGITFYSPCHAGCTTTFKQGSSTMFGNCSCIPVQTSVTESEIASSDYVGTQYETYGGLAKNGYPDVNCGLTFTLFTVMGFVKHLLSSTGRIGNILINYRCVEPHEVSFAQGLALFLLSLLAFIPGPIIYGYIIDNTCLIWDTSCGKEGNCWFYDRTLFRLYLNGTAAIFTTIAVILDAIVCYLARDVELYEEEDQQQTKEIKENEDIKKDTDNHLNPIITPPKQITENT